MSATCSVDKSEVWAGEPVRISATAHAFNPEHKLKYEWATNGGKVEGQGDSVTVNTTGVAEGQSYNVSAHVADSKDKKLVASCQASFATKKRLPPTITCRANPDSVTQGESLTIHSDASSPQGGQVTLAVQSDCAVTGEGADVNVNTANIQPGWCMVQCNVTDDHQLTANSTATFTVKAKPVVKPPEPPPSLTLRSVYFATGEPTEKDPNGGLVSSQQAILNSIASDFKKYLAVRPDAKLVLEAYADPRGSDAYNQRLTERRTARVKRFFLEQNIPPDTIETLPLSKQHQLTPEEVRQSFQDDPSLTAGEKTRLLRNMRIIVLAANRRVDLRLEVPGVPSQLSQHRYPFSDADALSLIGGREKRPPTIACSANPTNVVLGGTVKIHCDVTSPQGDSVTLTHQVEGQTWDGPDFSINTADLHPGSYTVESKAVDAQKLTTNSKTSFTVLVSLAKCQGLVMFSYPSPIDLSGVSTPDTQFTLVVGRVPEELSKAARDLRICAEQDCGTKLLSALSSASCTEIVKVIANNEVYIWPIDSMTDRMNAIIGPPLDDIKRTVGSDADQDVSPTGKWQWIAKVPDETNPTLTLQLNQLKSSGGYYVNTWTVTLKTSTGVMTYARSKVPWLYSLNHLLEMLGGLAATLLSIWGVVKKGIFRSRRKTEAQPDAQKQPPIVIIVPTQKAQDTSLPDPPPRDRPRRRAHRRGE